MLIMTLVNKSVFHTSFLINKVEGSSRYPRMLNTPYVKVEEGGCQYLIMQ